MKIGLGHSFWAKFSLIFWACMAFASPGFGQIDLDGEEKPDIFSLQFTFKKSMLTNSLPNIARKNHLQVLPFRHSNPYSLEIGFQYNKPIEFSLAAGMGYHNQNQSGLLCMDNCEFEDNFTSETKILTYEGRIKFYDLQSRKKIWWVASFENIVYEWQDLGRFKKADFKSDLESPSTTWQGKMYLNILHAGIVGETYFTHGPVKLGVEAVVKFPVYVYNRFELFPTQEDYGNKLLRQFAPFLGLGFKILL